MARLIFLTLYLTFHCTNAYGQWRGPIVEKFGPENGLDGWIRDIAQDSLGYIYFATDKGLYQYDGETFHLYIHNPDDPASISPGHIHHLYVSSDGLIWMTIYQSGLNSFDPQTSKFTTYEYPDHGLDDDHIGASALYEGSEGDIWLGSHHYSLLRLDRKTGNFKTYVPPWIERADIGMRAQGISRVLQDRFDPDILWLTIHKDAAPNLKDRYYGVISFNKKTEIFEWHSCNLQVDYQDETGKLWGTIWGSPIKTYDPKTKICDTISISSLYPNENEWVGPISYQIIPSKNGFYVANRTVVDYQPGIGASSHFQLEDKRSFRCLLIDRQHNLWMGHHEGVYVQAHQNQHIRFFSLSMFGLEDRQYPGRLAFDPASETIYYPDIMPNLKGQKIYEIPAAEQTESGALALDVDFYVSGISMGPDNRLWLAGNGSFHQYDRSSQSSIAESSESMMPGTIPWMWNMQTHDKGWIAGAGTKEFIWFHPREKKIKRYSITDLKGYTDIWNIDGFSFASDEKAIIFAHTQLIEVNLITGQSKLIKWPESLREKINVIQYAGLSNDGFLWVSLLSTVYKFQYASGELKLDDKYSVQDGISGTTVVEMHLDHKGRVWLFSGLGIDCLNPKTREIRHFGVREGLPTSFIDPRQVITISGGQIATVCSNGLIVFHPDSLWNSSSPQNLPIIIQEVRVNGQASVPDTIFEKVEKYNLPIGQQVVDVKFQALSFPTNRKVNYSYRINQNDWIEIGNNNFVTLPDLSYGNTNLEIRTGNGESPTDIKQISFNKATPLQAQWWFPPVILLAAGLLIFILYKNRIKQIQRKEEEKTETNKKFAELELTALRSQMNPHFMFNSLNSIKTYILEAKPDVAAEYLSQFAHLIRRILQNSREKLISLEEELDTLLLYISLEQFRFEDAFEFVQEVDKEIDLQQVMIPPMILQPFIENAIWHGLMHKKRVGILTLKFQREHAMVHCIVDDNGVGREKAKSLKSLSARRHKSMGMGITQNRIQLLNQMDTYGMSIEIIDKKDEAGNAKGTKVVVKIPLDLGDE